MFLTFAVGENTPIAKKTFLTDIAAAKNNTNSKYFYFFQKEKIK